TTARRRCGWAARRRHRQSDALWYSPAASALPLRLPDPGVQRHFDVEQRSPRRLTHVEGAAVALDDLARHGEAEAGAAAWRLGGEEWFEDSFAEFDRYSFAA